MLDEGNALNMMETPDAPPPEEKSNRRFLIVGGVVAGLVFLTLVCMAIYFLVIAPRSTAQKNAAEATREAQNAEVVQQLTSTAQAALWTATLPPTLLPSRTSTSVPRTPEASPTPVIAIALNSPAATATTDPATQVALQTQLAFQMTSTAAAVQGMPATGFFDEVGLPSMIILALVLVVVIFLARRMRKSTAK
jgi:heme/copper-type cytochrome/quinol oxidase subunit 2